jgi:hypothetical protein
MSSIPVLYTENAVEGTNITTTEESLFADALIHAIAAEGFNLELYRNVFLGHQGTVMRPDIYIPAYGFVVEVNGPRHERTDVMAKDARNRTHYEKLKLFVYEVSNADAKDGTSRTKKIAEIIAHLKSNALDAKRRGLIRVNVCAGRKTVADKTARFTSTLDTMVTFSEGALKGFRAIPSFGGSKFIFRKKRVSRA